MDISFAFGSFAVLLGAWAVAARRHPRQRPIPGRRLQVSGEAGFLRRLAG